MKMRLRDNGFFPTGSVGVPLSEERLAAEQWQPMVVQGKPPRSKGEHYYVELEIAGEDQTVWLDGLYVGEWTGATSEAAALPKLHSAGVVLKPEAAWGLVTGQEPVRAQATGGAVSRWIRRRLGRAAGERPRLGHHLLRRARRAP